MKVVLEFNLPEEREDYRNARLGTRYKILLDELDNELRNVTKYNVSLVKENKQASSIEIQMAEYLRNYIARELYDYE